MGSKTEKLSENEYKNRNGRHLSYFKDTNNIQNKVNKPSSSRVG